MNNRHETATIPTWLGICTTSFFQVGMSIPQCLRGDSGFLYHLPSIINIEYIGETRDPSFAQPIHNDPIYGHSFLKTLGQWDRVPPLPKTNNNRHKKGRR